MFNPLKILWTVYKVSGSILSMIFTYIVGTFLIGVCLLVVAFYLGRTEGKSIYRPYKDKVEVAEQAAKEANRKAIQLIQDTARIHDRAEEWTQLAGEYKRAYKKEEALRVSVANLLSEEKGKTSILSIQRNDALHLAERRKETIVFYKDTLGLTRKTLSQVNLALAMAGDDNDYLSGQFRALQAEHVLTKTVANRVGQIETREARSAIFLFTAFFITVLNLLSFWAKLRRQAGLAAFPDLREASLALARRLPFF